MRVLGIDLSSSPAETAACVIDTECLVLLKHIQLGCTDSVLVELASTADVVGVDAPFGWPTMFRDAVNGWSHREWNPKIRDALRFRLTDQIVRAEVGLSPLSVSSDRIALPAMRAMSLLAELDVSDKSGDGRVFEVYPAATLKRWGLPFKGYKKESDTGHHRRGLISEALAKRCRLDVTHSSLQSHHCLDAVIAGLTAIEAKEKRTRVPSSEEMETATREGWIHFPV